VQLVFKKGLQNFQGSGDCGLIYNNHRGLFAKLYEITISQIYFPMGKSVDRVHSASQFYY
jgi:hypothetical protein